MLAVCRRPGLNQESLSETLVMDKGTTAKAVKELERAGCIVRKPDQIDGRINRLYPTPCGDAMRTRIDRFLREWNDILWRGFSESERAQSCDLLQRMAANAQARWLHGMTAPNERSNQVVTWPIGFIEPPACCCMSGRYIDASPCTMPSAS